MVQRLLIYDRNHPDASIRYDLSYCFARAKGGATILKLFALQIYPNLCPMGGGSVIKSLFSQIQNSPHFPKEVGVRSVKVRFCML